MLKFTRRKDRITCGPFRWVQIRNSGHPDGETWALDKSQMDWPVAWYIKNYGGAPGPGFHGWKLGSGGPFDSAGAYADLKSAVLGVTPWLVGYMGAAVEKELQQQKKLLQQLNKLQKAKEAMK